MKDAAKTQLKKTLTDLKKEELRKIDKKAGIKRVESAGTNGEERGESRKRSLFGDEVGKYISSKVCNSFRMLV